MTPKEKAHELVDKYRNSIMSFLSDNMKDMNAKQCALIAVDELIKETSFEVPNIRQTYWHYVKQEIEKL